MTVAFDFDGTICKHFGGRLFNSLLIRLRALKLLEFLQSYAGVKLRPTDGVIITGRSVQSLPKIQKWLRKNYISMVVFANDGDCFDKKTIADFKYATICGLNDDVVFLDDDVEILNLIQAKLFSSPPLHKVLLVKVY